MFSTDEMNIKVSVIIPIYNMEAYIEQCLDSLEKQTYHDFELIIVNDGSTDQSGEICEAYRTKFKDIKIIYKNM